MAQQETRRQQIARRLRLSERALEQYLQLKRAEVEDDSGEVSLSTAATAERREHVSEQRQGYKEKRV